jgi:large subunit ribosomal protein L9
MSRNRGNGMEVILTMDVPDVGTRGDRLNVAAGFARNYLLPRGLAVPVTKGHLRAMAEEGKLTGLRNRKARHEAGKVADFLGETDVFATLRIGREGKAFGAITSRDIAILLKRNGLEVDRRKIQLDKPLKRLGVFDVPISIHPEVKTVVKVYVDREGGSREGALAEQAAYEEEQRIAAETAKAEAEARAAREAEAEEAARVALERAAARRAREEAEREAREQKAAEEAKAASEEEPEKASEDGGSNGKGGEKPSRKTAKKN